MTTTIEPQPAAAPADEKFAGRQLVNFMFFRTDRAFRREPAEL